MIAILASALASGSAFQTPDLSARVQYENAGALAKSVLADLSRLTKVHLDAGPETGGEILCIRCSGDPLNIVMEHIAWAVDGEWRKKDDGYRLIRDPGEQRIEERHEQDIRAAALSLSLAQLSEQADAGQVFDADAAERLAREIQNNLDAIHNPGTQVTMQIDVKSPSDRTFSRLLSACNADDLAAMPPQSKVVYSTRPTATQRPFTDAMTEVLRQHASEQNLLSQAFEAVNQGHPDRSGPRAPMLYTGRFDDAHIGCVLLVASRWNNWMTGVQFDLSVADPLGRTLTTQNGFVPLAPVLKTAVRPPTAPPPGQPVTADVEEAASFVSAKGPISAGLRDQFLDPEHHEPLGLGWGRALLIAAKGKNESLVANLPDSIMARPAGIGRQLAPDNFLDSCRRQFADQNPAADWIGLRPTWQAQERAMRVDRGALGRLLRRCHESGSLSLDEEAAFSLQLAEYPDNQMVRRLRMAIRPRDPGEQNDARLLRFYGLLDLDQRQAAQANGVRIGDLAPAAQRELDRILYGPMTSMSLNPQPDRSGAQTDWSVFYQGIFREPTECVPNGLPPDGLVKLRSNSFSRLKAINGSGEQDWDAGSFAWMRFQMDRPDLFPASSFNPLPMSRLTLGKQNTVSFTFQLTPELSFGGNLSATDYGDDRPMRYGQLPAEFRKQVDELYGNYQNAYSRMPQRGYAGPGNPPPAP